MAEAEVTGIATKEDMTADMTEATTAATIGMLTDDAGRQVRAIGVEVAATHPYLDTGRKDTRGENWRSHLLQFCFIIIAHIVC